MLVFLAEALQKLCLADPYGPPSHSTPLTLLTPNCAWAYTRISSIENYMTDSLAIYIYSEAQLKHSDIHR